VEEGLSVSPSVTQDLKIENGSRDTPYINSNQPESGYIDVELKKTTDIPDYLEFISTENSNPPNNLSPSEPNLDTLPATDIDTVFLTAGKIDDFKFNITNNNNNAIRNAVITLTANSGALEILGSSKWNIDAMNPNTTLQFPTKIFASKTLINSLISFEVNAEYVSNGQLKSDSFNIGVNVVGEIEISINDLSVDNIGETLNVVGNLLNKGNTGGLFTTVELFTDKDILEREIQKLSSTGQNISTLKIVTPSSTTPEYLGDLEEDSPLPFNIPLSTSNNSSSGNYLVPIKIEYYDDLRNLYVINASNIVKIDLPQQTVNENQGLWALFSLSNPLGLVFLIIFIIVIIIILRFLRKKSKRKKIAKSGQNKSNSSFIDLLDSVKKDDILQKKKDGV